MSTTREIEGSGRSVPEEPSPLVVVGPGRSADAEPAPVSRRRVLAPILVGAAVVGLLVAFSGSVAARRLAEKESVTDAAKSAALLADAVVQPALQDGLATGDPQAFAAMDRAVRDHVLGASSVRVKIWTASGRIVYSDEPRLVGQTFPLGDEERSVFTHPVTRAEVSDLGREENRFERGQGRLLEVYRPVWTPSGEPLLFETYASFDGVTSRAGQLWRGFAGITVSSLLGLIVLMVPVVWRLLTRIRQSQQQRERLLERAVEASTDERRRIAGTLHDGVIQELAGASFVVSGAAVQADRVGQPELAAQLREASGTVRRGIGGMRTLLVDIYPPNLETSGLAVALEDLATGLRSRNVDVALDLESTDDLNVYQARLVYRVANECLVNCMRHALATHVSVTLARHDTEMVLEIADDGLGFDAEHVLGRPPEGHFGIKVLADVVREAGAELLLASAPGKGTRWRLRVPLG
jgi:two-component system, NarL family, sensor kinase